MKWNSKFSKEMKQEYVICSETIAILPDYNENGILHSLICKKQGVIKAAISPFNLIDLNLRFRGSSMRGALDGACAILDKKLMNPLILDKERDIILFPSRSPYREDCVWLSLNHVKRYGKSGASHTQVKLSDNFTINLDISLHTFSMKIQRAYELKYKMQTHMLQFDETFIDDGDFYHLTKNENELNYRMGELGE